MEFVIISGLSGAGKSRAAGFMEDMGYFCVDNLPVPLFQKFAELGMAGNGEYDRVVLVTDVRSVSRMEGLLSALDDLAAMHCPYKILFMEASDDVIIKRYKETRRVHPLAGERDTLEEAIALERELLSPLRERADFILDSSGQTLSALRGELMDLFGHGRGARESMTVRLTSFGFKHGLPREADLVLDVRFLPNPFYLPQLRTQTGLDEGVRAYVMDSPLTGEFLARLEGLLDFLLPRYVEEGKSALVIAVGCTGGRHRSVAVTHALAEYVRGLGYTVTEGHRDMDRI